MGVFGVLSVGCPWSVLECLSVVGCPWSRVSLEYRSGAELGVLGVLVSLECWSVSGCPWSVHWVSLECRECRWVSLEYRSGAELGVLGVS